MDAMRRSDWVVAAIAVLCTVVSLWQLEAGRSGLVIEQVAIGDTPATVVRAESAEGDLPVVVIAHGFAGSRKLMEPFAFTLARAGYLAVSFDFVGHGEHPAPLPIDPPGFTRSSARLLQQLDAVVAYARGLDGAGRRYALLGHSMATDLLAKAAREGRPSARAASATVAVSLLSTDVTALSPRNMLVIVGGLEDGLTDEAVRVVNLTANAVAEPNASPPPRDARLPGMVITRGLMGEVLRGSTVMPKLADMDQTVGTFFDGTARRAVEAPGVEHIGVLYDPVSLAAAVAWLDVTLREGTGDGGVRDGAAEGDGLDRRGLWLGVLFTGLTLAGRPLSRLLPVLAPQPAGAGARWRLLAALIVGPALLAPLAATTLPSGLMPIVLGDYLAKHFFFYGLFTAAGLWLAARRGLVALPRWGAIPWGGLAVSAAAVAVFTLVVFGLTLERYAFPFVPSAAEAIYVPVFAAALLPWFLADEWLTRRVADGAAGSAAETGARLWAYLASKFAFVVSLGIAVALAPEQLFFLAIIAPVMLAFFAVYAMISQWVMARTGHPFATAGGLSVALAWSIAVSFPLAGA
ncbi:MAG: alpha/beta fold hydrolase [Pseudomonadota bacterium]